MTWLSRCFKTNFHIEVAANRAVFTQLIVIHMCLTNNFDQLCLRWNELEPDIL